MQARMRVLVPLALLLVALLLYMQFRNLTEVLIVLLSIPFALVAHRNSAFIGTASVIAADLEERPQYSPWVAAVWVDPQYRMREIGSALVARAVEETFALNFRRVYLCAEKERRRFYVRQGWNPIEEDVGERKLTVFVKQAGP